MNQQAQMTMAQLGGPVQASPSAAQGAGPMSQGDMMKRLNTAIYDYLLRNELWVAAKQFSDTMPFEQRDPKPSPNQRGGQANGAEDGMDMDSKDPILLKKPDDLPLPYGYSSDPPFLQDWWCHFWDTLNAHRYRTGSRAMAAYLQQQRTTQNMRNRQGQAGQANQMAFNGMMQPNGVGMANDLRRGAMQNSKNMTPTQMAQLKNMQANQANGQLMQGNNQMERSSSQLENMSGPRSGTPGSGDAPSPKRQRLEGGMQQMNQGRPGQPGQMQQGNQSVEIYSHSMQQQQKMQAAMNKANSNVNKGIPPNMGAGGAQGSPMSQPGMDGATGEFYAAANGGRMPMQGPNQVAAAAAAGQGSNGNHALQDYQMQLMLLEQQNKKRLLMARQEQDSMAHPAGMGQNGNFNTGSPTPGNMMDPNTIPPQMRGQMMANGQLVRPPSSHPMANMTPQQQSEMIARGVPMQNGQFPPGQQPPGQMMPGQQPGGQPGQGQQMGTPRQPNTNMPPPPAPQANAGGTQPGSPSAQPAPPTPSTQAKKGAGNKKEAAGKKGAAQKKGAANATPASEAEHPPTPTPQTPITPMNAKSFSQNQNQAQSLPNGQPTQAGGQANAHANANQQQQNQQNANPQPDPSGIPEPFGQLGDGADFPDMGLGFDSADMLDNFDFDSFLNPDAADGLQFDANFAFGDAIGSGIDGN